MAPAKLLAVLTDHGHTLMPVYQDALAARWVGVVDRDVLGGGVHQGFAVGCEFDGHGFVGFGALGGMRTTVHSRTYLPCRLTDHLAT